MNTQDWSPMDWLDQVDVLPKHKVLEFEVAKICFKFREI